MLTASGTGPPGVSIEDAYVQLFPIDKTRCPTIDPIRDIAYQLYTSENPLQPDPLVLDDDKALKRSHLDFSKPTVLFFHAFFETYTSAAATAIKTAYLQRKDHNVILLEAPRMEAGPWYVTAARNTRVVGEHTARFIDYLVSRGLYLPSLHLIGLSLGAQMAGVCGQNVKSGRIRRITGLDPAGPLFTKWPRRLKLDKEDAEFVDVIHTDAGIFGYPRSIGHVDFWPNQGISPQPGCTLREVKMRSPDSVVEPFFCSHWRSYMFYSESVITPNSFRSTRCKNWKTFVQGKCHDELTVNMGFSVSSEIRGNFYLTTRDVSPFSLQTPPPRVLLANEIKKAENQLSVQNYITDTVQQQPALAGTYQLPNEVISYQQQQSQQVQHIPHQQSSSLDTYTQLQNIEQQQHVQNIVQQSDIAQYSSTPNEGYYYVMQPISLASQKYDYNY